MATRIEALLPVGPRPRQLSVRSLLVGMLLCQADSRPAHLCRVHAALIALPQAHQERLGIVTDWKLGPHTLTYRQVEYTFGRVAAVLSKEPPDGTPSDLLSGVVADLIEASIPQPYKRASTSLAVDWTDHETFSCPPSTPDGGCADPEASWGHRRGDQPGQKHEAFYGYYLSAATTVADEGGAPVPELIRRITLTSCHHDPAQAAVPVLQRLAASGTTLGDVVTDSGYAYRVAQHWALPLRAAGARIVADLHPNDRGPRGTHAGAICANGNLYCPATPAALLQLNPLPPGPSPEQIAAHDHTTAEAARYKLGPITADDRDGYHRVACPATTGKIRCPQRPPSMLLPYDRPTITTPPPHPPACCTQKTVTVPVTINAKTRQKHDYPGAAWRASYARRTAAERANSTIKDPATTNINRGWCRLMGLTPILLFLTATVIVRNHRIIDAYTAKTANGQPPLRTCRRTTLTALANAPP